METLKTHFANFIDNNSPNNDKTSKSSKEINVRLLYDKWLCKESASKRQVVKKLSLSSLLETHPDWYYSGSYTTEDDCKSIDVWAIATGNDRYDYPETFSSEEIISVVTNIYENNDSAYDFFQSDEKCGYCVEDYLDAYCRTYYYPDYPIEKRIDMDPEVERFLSKQKLANFLSSTLDPNAAISLEKICLVWDDEDNVSKVRGRLFEDTCDEYSYYACEDNLGLTWVENQIVFVNVREIMNSAIEIGPDDFRSVSEIFTEGLLQTIFHECRHLIYECNELIEFGSFYPTDGDLEEKVEEYGNGKAKEWLSTFNLCIDNKELTSLINVETVWLIEQEELDL